MEVERHEFSLFFRSDDGTRDKFLSRVLGIFSEEIVRAWCACPEAPYLDLGRPTVRFPEFSRSSTLDFTFRSRAKGFTYATELKAELEFENYRYLELRSADQITHHMAKPAFQQFVRLTSDACNASIQVKQKPTTVDGSILIWGAVSPEGIESARAAFGFADVLALEQMLGDLRIWRPQAWQHRVERYQTWSNELWSFLASPEPGVSAGSGQ